MTEHPLDTLFAVLMDKLKSINLTGYQTEGIVAAIRTVVEVRAKEDAGTRFESALAALEARVKKLEVAESYRS